MKHLKIYTLLIALMMLFILPSCNKDEDNAKPDLMEMIVGKWFLTSQISDGSPMPIDDCAKQTFFEFKSGGGLNAESHYMDAGSCLVTNQFGEYSITSDKKYLVTKTSDATKAIPIIKLTKNELTLEYTSGSGSLTFTKQE